MTVDEDQVAHERGARRERVKALLSSGVSVRETARETGLSASRVSQIAAEEGIEVRTSGPEAPRLRHMPPALQPEAEAVQRGALSLAARRQEIEAQELEIRARHAELKLQQVERQLGGPGQGDPALVALLQAMAARLEKVEDRLTQPAAPSQPPVDMFTLFERFQSFQQRVAPVTDPLLMEQTAQLEKWRQDAGDARAAADREYQLRLADFQAKERGLEALARVAAQAVQIVTPLVPVLVARLVGQSPASGPAAPVGGAVALPCARCKQVVSVGGAGLWGCPACGAQLRLLPGATQFELLPGPPGSALPAPPEEEVVGSLSDGSMSSDDIARSVFAKALAQAQGRPVVNGPPRAGYTISGFSAELPGAPPGYTIDESQMPLPPAPDQG